MDALRVIESDSLRAFVEGCSASMAGMVLDYGSGRQPYRPIVEAAGGTYCPLDGPGYPGSVASTNTFPAIMETGSWNAILCTQVIQYVPDVPDLLSHFHRLLHGVEPGFLILTGPTCWPEVEREDLHRFTSHGISRLVELAGFTIVRCEVRAHVEMHGNRFPLGYGILAAA